ncbi:uncharacterized protein LOC123698934 [Colias croceus]|uniref:uncharacterized protein LOC123698934 n=1 Tax=Colias crocea TaxID=72248 RepID=UPI001E27D3CB|nr:uncharacterized protein LOC123698934 [Colias croceus]
MLFLIVLCLCASAWNAVSGQDLEAMKNMPKYDERYDYLDVDAIFNNKRLVRNYVDCLINGLRCTPEGKALRRLLPEALRTKCVRCSERQKKTAVKIIKRLKSDFPDEWAKLSSRWDPTGDFTRYFEVFLANEQFNSIPYNGKDTPTPPPPPPPPTQPPVTSQAPLTNPPSPRPLLLNRFGDDGDLMVGSPSSGVSQRSTTSTTMPSTRPAVPPRPTPSSWANRQDVMTRFPMRTEPTYTTAITFIDQIGIKIIRTTELVTDILKNTVRAVVG